MTLKNKEKALENLFINTKEKEIFANLKADKTKQDKKFLLQNVSGIDNQSILDNAINLGLSAESFSALTLVPLIKVAWADHICDKLEQDIILKIAFESGLNNNTSAYELLKSWLQKEINVNLFLTWEAYVTSLKEELTEGEIMILKEEIVGRAVKVAKASGGFFGIGSVSEEEKAIIKRIEEDFDKAI